MPLSLYSTFTIFYPDLLNVFSGLLLGKLSNTFTNFLCPRSPPSLVKHTVASSLIPANITSDTIILNPRLDDAVLC